MGRSTGLDIIGRNDDTIPIRSRALSSENVLGRPQLRQQVQGLYPGPLPLSPCYSIPSLLALLPTTWQLRHRTATLPGGHLLSRPLRNIHLFVALHLLLRRRVSLPALLANSEDSPIAAQRVVRPETVPAHVERLQHLTGGHLLQ